MKHNNHPQDQAADQAATQKQGQDTDPNQDKDTGPTLAQETRWAKANPLDHHLTQKREFIIRAMYYGLWGGLIFLLLFYGLGLVTPFIFAFLFAYIIRRLAVRTARTIHLPVKLISGLYVLLFYCTIGVLITLLGIGAVAKLADFVTNIPSLYEDQLQPLFNKIYLSLQQAVVLLDPDLADSLNTLYDQFLNSIGVMFSDLSVWILGLISSQVTSLPGFLIRLLLMVIATFFAAMDFDRFTGFVARQLTPSKRELLTHIKEYLTGTVLVVLRSYGIIMSVTAVELSIGLTIIGVQNSILVALAIALFDILPIFGTGGIMVPWTLIMLLQGDYQMAASLFAVYVIITIVRNIIEPKIVGPQLGLHPLVTLMSLFVGAQLFGILGLFGFPIGLSLLLNLNNKGYIRIFK